MTTPQRDASGTDAPLLDDERTKEICALMSLGLLQRVAARYVGLSDVEVARAAETDAALSADLYRAERKCEIRQLQNIQQAAETHWQAASWLLERLYPDHYARRGPEVITAEQLDYALARLSDVVLSHVPEPDRRDKIQAELGRLADELAQLRHGA